MSLVSVPVPRVELEPGDCWFVATPIGNLGDVTLRAVAVLAACDVVYAEDTRSARRLLQHFGLQKPLEAYHDHNKQRAVPRILERLAAGERVAVVSDAGMPCISDPGFTLVRALREVGRPWSVAPGASSVLMGLVLAGFEPDRFVFAGYPPRKSGARARWLSELLELDTTVILLESVHRIRSTLEALAELAPARELAVCREMTKLHEETLRGDAATLLAQLTGPRLKGELVLLLRRDTATPRRGGTTEEPGP
ncbi:MAG: 16S rRNA (cytidine(1402)-2'-O)-methyltransferase [Candidatus Krumholzibacteriia bacterium]